MSMRLLEVSTIFKAFLRSRELLAMREQRVLPFFNMAARLAREPGGFALVYRTKRLVQIAREVGFVERDGRLRCRLVHRCAKRSPSFHHRKMDAGLNHSSRQVSGSPDKSRPRRAGHRPPAWCGRHLGFAATGGWRAARALRRVGDRQESLARCNHGYAQRPIIPAAARSPSCMVFSQQTLFHFLSRIGAAFL